MATVPRTALEFKIDFGTQPDAGTAATPAATPAGAGGPTRVVITQPTTTTPTTSVTIKDRRATALINKVGAPSFNSAQIKIWGLTLDLMNQLSRVGQQPNAVRNNIVTVNAGNVGGQMSLAFCGVIWEAWPEFESAEGEFNITANTGLLAQMKTVTPTSYPGNTDVKVIMQNLANQMGYTLEANNVSVQLSNPYLPGTARMQALAAAEAANIYVVFDDDNGTMALVPKSGSRSGSVPLLDPTVGTLVGYPSYVGPGRVGLKSPYNPQLRFLGNVEVRNSVITGANGKWRIDNLVHNLSSELPGGPWFSEMVGGLVLDGQNT